MLSSYVDTLRVNLNPIMTSIFIKEIWTQRQTPSEDDSRATGRMPSEDKSGEQSDVSAMNTKDC